MTITVNGVDYDNEKDAKKAMAKAKREERKQEKILKERNETARLRACEAYVLVAGTVQRRMEGMQSGAFRRNAVYQRNTASLSGITTYRMQLQTEHGYSESEAVDTMPVNELHNVCGLTAVSFLEHDEKIAWYAVGVCEETVSFIEIPELIASEMSLVEFYDPSA